MFGTLDDENINKPLKCKRDAKKFRTLLLCLEHLKFHEIIAILDMFFISSLPITILTYPFRKIFWIYQNFKPPERGTNTDKHVDSLQLKTLQIWSLENDRVLTEFRLRTFGDKWKNLIEAVFFPLHGELCEDDEKDDLWIFKVKFPKHSKLEKVYCKSGRKGSADLRFNKILKTFKSQKSRILLLESEVICVGYKENNEKSFKCSPENER